MADELHGMGCQCALNPGPVSANDAVMRIGRIHRQLQVIESQRGDFVNLLQNRLNREIHGTVEHTLSLNLCSK